MNAKLNNVGEGGYQSVVTDANGCLDSLRVSLHNTPPAQAFFASYPSHIEALTLNQANVIFQNQSQGSVYYSWTFGDGFNSSAPNPVHQFNEAGTYNATLWAFNSYNACPTNYSLTYVILPNGSIYIPTAFSPNNDGINDFFEIRGEGIQSFECEIFNRWGVLIHKMNRQNDTWDGREMNSGKEVQEGAYTYQLKALLNDGNRIDRGGTITIIR
jgi:gliding motility-associated-like protein